MKSPRISEIGLHRSVADFLSWTVLPPAVWTTFPAGWTAMNTGAAGRLKGCGLKAGMPDILVFSNGFTIGIELKTTKGVVSPVQEKTFADLRKAGVPVHIASSVDEVEEYLCMHSIPMRGHSLGKIPNPTPEGRRPKEPAQGAPTPA